MYNKADLAQIKTYLESTKKRLSTRPVAATRDEITNTKAYLVSLEGDLNKQLGDLAIKQDVAYAATALTVLTMIVTWLMGQPLWVQVALGIVALIIVVGIIVYIAKSKDPRATIIELIQLIQEIYQIINNLPIGQAPVASFSVSPNTGQAPLTVAFTDRSTGSPTSYMWTFGDNTTSNQQNPSHVYTVSGTFSVSLTASNAYGGNTITMNGLIVVTAPTPPVSNTPPGEEYVNIGTATVTKFTDINLALAGGNGWPGLTVKVMSDQDPDLDVLPNNLAAFWAAWANDFVISHQGYHYPLPNAGESGKNVGHFLVPAPWLSATPANSTRMSDCISIDYDPMLHDYVGTVKHDGTIERILWLKNGTKVPMIVKGA